MKRIQNVSRAKILVLYPQRTIRMEGTSDGINFIAIHEFRISLILFWISNFMGKDEKMMDVCCGETIKCMDYWILVE